MNLRLVVSERNTSRPAEFSAATWPLRSDWAIWSLIWPTSWSSDVFVLLAGSEIVAEVLLFRSVSEAPPAPTPPLAGAAPLPVKTPVTETMPCAKRHSVWAALPVGMLVMLRVVPSVEKAMDRPLSLGARVACTMPAKLVWASAALMSATRSLTDWFGLSATLAVPSVALTRTTTSTGLPEPTTSAKCASAVSCPFVVTSAVEMIRATRLVSVTAARNWSVNFSSVMAASLMPPMFGSIDHA